MSVYKQNYLAHNLFDSEKTKEIIKKKYPHILQRIIDRVLKYKVYCVQDPVNSICCIFKIRDTEGLSFNYSILFIETEKFWTKIYNQTNKINEYDSKNYRIGSCSISPSLISQDGEYRDKYVFYKQVEEIYRYFPSIMNDIENYINKKITQYDLSVEYDLFYPQISVEEEISQIINNKIIDSGINKKLLSCFWLKHIYDVVFNIQENNIAPMITKVFMKDIKDDISIYKKLLNKFDSEQIRNILLLLTHNGYYDKQNKNVVALGIDYGKKIKPMSINEVQYPFNIKYQTWKELYINDKTLLLFINNISGYCPINISWAYLKDTKMGLFDNPSQVERFKLSEKAINIIRKLKEAQNITYTLSEAKQQDKNFFNDAFENVFDKIDNPIDYIKNNIIMSNVTMVFSTESVGRPFGDMITLNKTTLFKNIGLNIKKPEIMNKLIWDICYQCLCLSIKLKIIHNDLHLNNCTVRYLENDGIVTDKSVSYYNIADLFYKFDTIGKNAYIIDFSRSVIHHDLLTNEMYKKRYLINEHDKDVFINNQISRILSKYESIFPSFIKMNESLIEELMINDFDKFFKIYSCIDLYDFSKRCREFFDKTIDQSSLAILSKIEKLTEYYLTTYMIKVANNRNINVDFVNLDVIKEVFVDNIVDSFNDNNKEFVYEYYSLNNELKLTVEDIVNDTGIKKNKNINIEEFKKIYDSYKRIENYKKDSIEMVDFIAYRHQGKY